MIRWSRGVFGNSLEWLAAPSQRRASAREGVGRLKDTAQHLPRSSGL
jgi:hypothetical protein